MKTGRRVVVTGGGIASSLGFDLESAFARLRSLKNCVRRMDDWDRFPQMNTRLASPVDLVMPDFPRRKIRGLGRVGRLALVATDSAVKCGGFEGSPELGAGRFGIAYGSSMSSVDAMLEIYGMLINNDMKAIDATTYIRAMPQTCAANLEVFYGLTGRLISCNTACTSGSMAIGYAYETIRNGVQDVMIAGGADELSAVDGAIFDTLFAASSKNDSPDKTPAAYDKNRDGLVVGEGAGTLILEEYEHACKRGAKIYAEIIGFGTNTDGTHITSGNAVTQAKALRMAIDDAGISPDDIGYVNTHGTATGAGDIAETQATWSVFQRPVPVSTLKNYTGHTLGACGAIEAWLSIAMMNQGW
ncbi:MAG: beta-ketoacyl-ACP synthase, partial [Treponema sp.]|nr:beta-ketoacyl-ACP synthase [Treponema sp.]